MLSHCLALAKRVQMLDFFKKFKEIFIFFAGIIAFIFIKSSSDKKKDEKISDIKSKNNNLKGQNQILDDNISSVGSEIKKTNKSIKHIKKEIKRLDEDVSDNKDNPKKFFDDRGF